ncbi:MAG: methionyl-tRNA formyltransferase [Micavibrio sp.]
MTQKPLRIAFMGTPDFAVAPLKALIGAGHEMVCVYSQPPRPKGRGKKLQESPVHCAALEAGIEVRTPPNFKKDEDIAAFMALDLDVAVVAAYGLILPKLVLDAPRFGCINIHASLLPRWRGAAPIHRAIAEGDEESGITIMQMEEGLDTGPIISMQSVPIRASTTTQSLHDILSALGATMIRDAMAALAADGKLDSTPQPQEGATYAKMLKKEEGLIDWSKSALVLDRQIRAFNPWPGTWCVDSAGRRLKITAASVVEGRTENVKKGTLLDADGVVACGDGTCLRLELVQPESKAPMDARAAINGGYLIPGRSL